MVLQYQMSGPGLANQVQPKQEAQEQKKKAKRPVLICFLLLVYIIIMYIGYNFWVAERGTPVWETLQKSFKADLVSNLWTARKKAAKMRKSAVTKPGTVTAILHSDGSSCALINHKLVREGDITNGVKIVRIDRCEVEFEKNGERWTQEVLAKPSPAWEATKQPAG